MRLRKPISAALLGVGALLFVVFAMGSGSFPPSFGDPFNGLSATLQDEFVAGQEEFETVETVAGGLGPVFNNVSCAACHSAPAVGGGSTTLETRYGTFTDGVFNPLTQYGGSLIHSQGIGLYNGVKFVGEIVPQPPAVRHGPATIVAGRRTTPLFGLGLVDAVPDAEFQVLAAIEQKTSPSTAGRVNIVSDVLADGQAPQALVGRFGWKCQHGALFGFCGDAYLNEMGITTPLVPNENCPQDPTLGWLANCALLAANPASSNPNEPDNDDLTAFTNFISLLAPPTPLPQNAQARQGAQIFEQIGCANCHTATLKAGPSPIPQINNQVFHPYSDFLLHNMGSLGDNIAQSGAGQREMRTAPLWGVRVITTFLHDGRASTLSKAILDHAGQGAAASQAFANLSATNQAALIAFLNTL
jgi:CxxC motif-containing protein (DUF1111 family)